MILKLKYFHRIQSQFRGKKARDKVQERREMQEQEEKERLFKELSEEQTLAATKIQAVARGKQDRKMVSEKRLMEEETLKKQVQDELQSQAVVSEQHVVRYQEL